MARQKTQRNMSNKFKELQRADVLEKTRKKKSKKRESEMGYLAKAMEGMS